MKVLITGGGGFVGNALVRHLLSDRQHCPVVSVRRHDANLPEGVDIFCSGDLRPDNDWSTALAGVDVVIHTAARVHVLKDSAHDPLSEFRLVNTQGTENLARQADEAGVRRFIFLSSIGVNGAETTYVPFNADSSVAPHSPYAISKYEAELCLFEISDHSHMDVVIIRPPLIYGPGAPGNWAMLMRWLWRGVPLPLGLISNKRSFVSLDNLLDLIVTCIDHPAAKNQTFLVSDGEDVSTTELLLRMGRALGKPAKLIPVPERLLKAGAILIGKRAFAQRLCGSLQVETSKTRELLGWEPPVSMEASLRETAQDFLDMQSK